MATSLSDRAKDFYLRSDYIKALEAIDDMFSARGNDDGEANLLQGAIFKDLAEETENTDVKFAYWLASVECYSRNAASSMYSADSMFNLAEQIGSVLYYKKSLGKAKEGLCRFADSPSLNNEKERVEYIIETAESRIADFKTRVGSAVKTSEQQVRESEENEETGMVEHDLVRQMRSYWADLDVEFKRNFMKVSTADLTIYIEHLFGRDGREAQDALEQALSYARKNEKWKFWLCRTCAKKFSTPDECKSHLEQEHAAASRKDMPWRISEFWAHNIYVGGWKPVDAAAAVKMIKERLADVKAFAYQDGWCKDWPLAESEERSKLLKEIKSLLVSFCDHKILTVSIQECLRHFVVRKLEKLDVCKQMLTDCRLLETPQSICFLECGELNQVLDFLRNIKCERDDGTDLVCRAVDSLCGDTRFKEKIDFDSQFSFLLLDKRLLHCKLDRFDDEGKINLFNPDVHYAKALAHGDDMVSWLTDDSSVDEKFQFPKPIKEHNLVIWVAVLRAAQFTCRTLGTKHAKRLRVLGYRAALNEARQLCASEYEKRKTLPEGQWIRYASLLCDRCQESDAGNPLTTDLLCAVRDVLKGALHPTFDLADLEDCRNDIHECKNLSDDIVLNSMELLESKVNNKVGQIDSKILLIEKSRINLLNDLTRLSAFDYRSYVRGPLKSYLFAILSKHCPAPA